MLLSFRTTFFLAARGLGNHHGPVITVEDTGSQLRINNVKPNVNQALLETSCSFEKSELKVPKSE